MKKKSSYCARGQVFYYNPLWAVFGKDKVPNNIKPNGSLEFKTRPYLVTSNDTGNFSSTLVNMVPITTRDRAVLPCHVEFTYDQNPQVVLCEQPCTANIKDLGEYHYTLSNETMAEVDKAIAIQQGLKAESLEVKMDDLMNNLNSVVDKVLARAKQKASMVTSSQIEDMTLKLAMGFEELLPKVASEETTQESPRITQESEKQSVEETLSQAPKIAPSKQRGAQTKELSQIDKFNMRYGRTQPEKVEKLEPEKPTKRTRQPNWDIEKCKQFLRDFDTMTPDAIAEKYGYKDKRVMFSRKYAVRTRLESQGIDYNK